MNHRLEHTLHIYATQFVITNHFFGTVHYIDFNTKSFKRVLCDNTILNVQALS